MFHRKSKLYIIHSARVAVLVLLWLLHQKGLFDPLYDWWEDHFEADYQSSRGIRRHRVDFDHPHIHVNKHHEQQPRHHKHGPQYKRRSIYHERRHNHSNRDTDYYHYLHHVHKDKHKHGHSKNLSTTQRLKKGRQDEFHKRKRRLLNDTQFNLHAKRGE